MKILSISEQILQPNFIVGAKSGERFKCLLYGARNSEPLKLKMILPKKAFLKAEVFMVSR